MSTLPAGSLTSSHTPCIPGGGAIRRPVPVRLGGAGTSEKGVDVSYAPLRSEIRCAGWFHWPVTDQRGRLLVAALGFAGLPLPSYDRALHALRTWLDSWAGIGRVAVGMARQGYDLQLTRYDEKGWRATFYTTGTEDSITSATASGETWAESLARASSEL